MSHNHPNRTRAANIARETLAIIGSGHYVTPAGRRVSVGDTIARCVNGSQTYPPGRDASWRRPAEPRATRFEVTGETTLEAARRLAGEGHRVCALNFASAKNPGGGFLNGSRAQEESIARSSALYAAIRGNPMYDYHRQRSDALYTPYAIYSPDVPVWMDDQGMLLDEPWPCSFVTSPAPNAGVARERDGASAGRIRDALAERIGKVLGIMAAHDYPAIVLGAWGCGVFRNDPAEVAEVFREAFERSFAGVFERVTFAVFDRSTGGETRRPFEREFAAR